MGIGVSEDVRVVRARVRGRVQGVGFRWYVARHAEQWSIAGWVRNASDGSVEVLIAGAADKVQHLLDDLRRGPPHALVQTVDVEERPNERVDVNAEFEILP